MKPIYGDRIMLRDFSEADVSTYIHWNTPGHKWQELDGPYYAKPTIAEAEAAGEILRQQTLVKSWPNPRMRLVIADASSGELLGFVTSYWESQETNWLSIGIVIFDEDNWRRGYGREALEMWIDYLFAHRSEIVRLDLRTWSGNTGMMRLAERLGFLQEACFRKARIVNGEYYDGLAYGILREEWAAHRSAESA